MLQFKYNTDKLHIHISYVEKTRSTINNNTMIFLNRLILLNMYVCNDSRESEWMEFHWSLVSVRNVLSIPLSLSCTVTHSFVIPFFPFSAALQFLFFPSTYYCAFIRVSIETVGHTKYKYIISFHISTPKYTLRPYDMIEHKYTKITILIQILKGNRLFHYFLQ